MENQRPHQERCHRRKDAVLTQDAKSRAETLARARQRIHAGRMMVEHPGGPPEHQAR